MINTEDFNSFKKGDKRLFKQVFDSFYKGLFLFARKYIASDSEVEDLLQEVFVMLWEKKDQLADAMSLKAFLYVSVRNKALNKLRHQKVVDEHQKEMLLNLSGEAFYKENLIEEETYRLLLNAIDTLPVQTRRVCQMVMNGARNVDIAEELEISKHTVKYHKQQAFSVLREKLSDYVYVLPILIALFET
ncbi:MAG: RNA polymerase sigma-70 factor [Carboxylicivirga sp.]|jgi:RNA polymerase sigma-70 factor (ECF subfamily)|nr:RNA polymerase sigma-70 factor [Carboxylicivirga sp.]MCT4644701.1 RNA polymerase sigma-70 factor [Carboxylicivirga sp.]